MRLRGRVKEYPCPNCGLKTPIFFITPYPCSHCRTPLYIEYKHTWRPRLATALIIIVLGLATWRRFSGGAWLLLLVSATVPLLLVTAILFLDERATTIRPRRKLNFTAVYFGLVLVLFCENFLLGGGLPALLGTRRDFYEQMQALSV